MNSASIAKQLQIQAPGANNQLQGLPFGCSLFLYRVSTGQLVPARIPDASGLVLMSLPACSPEGAVRLQGGWRAR